MVFTVTSEPGEGSTVLHLAGELDLAGRNRLLRCVERGIAEGRPEMALDLDKLAFCDSTGLATMIRARRLCVAAGGWLHVFGAQGQVASVLSVTGLGALLLSRQRPTRTT